MGATILIVDADRKFVGRLRTLFSAHRYSVLSASTAVDGMAAIAEFKGRIALVIVGVELPDGQGLGIVGRIARWTFRTKPKVIAACDGPLTEATVQADRTLAKAGTDQEWLKAVAALSSLAGSGHR